VSGLTLDLGTSATKAALWDGAKLVALTRAPLVTTHPQPGWAEQDPESWCAAVVDVCSELRHVAPAAFGAIDTVGFSATRETFALFDADLRPLSAGILWSDRRADEEVASLGDAGAFRARTGVIASAGCCAAKVAWAKQHRPDAFTASRWLLAPRDFVFARLTGEVLTDETLASRTGFFALDGTLVDNAPSDRLPPVVPATTSIGAGPGRFLEAVGLVPGVRVVIGAGDRACEVLGVGAGDRAPMVSWGTTANVSIPHPGPVGALPRIAQVSRGALGGFVVEAGLSAAGAAIAWLGSLTGRSHDDLLAMAAEVPPGARGCIALPWLAGARAPWWQAGAHAAFVGITEAHGPAELARAMVEGVAFDVARCIELIAPDAELLALAGGGTAHDVWREVVSGVTGLPVVRRSIDDAGSVGARLVVGAAENDAISVDDLSPALEREEGGRGLVSIYSELRGLADDTAKSVLGSED
jgi:xylulokinase